MPQLVQPGGEVAVGAPHVVEIAVLGLGEGLAGQQGAHPVSQAVLAAGVDEQALAAAEQCHEVSFPLSGARPVRSRRGMIEGSE